MHSCGLQDGMVISLNLCLAKHHSLELPHLRILQEKDWNGYLFGSDVTRQVKVLDQLRYLSTMKTILTVLKILLQ